MGGRCSRQTPHKFIILGLDCAGKTSLLYRLKLGEVVTTIPTIGFNVETVTTHAGMEFIGWDIGGRDKLRALYRHYYPGTSGFIYVIDSTDQERIHDAFRELQEYVLVSDETQNSVLMILANKQDLEHALSPAEIEEKFKELCKFNATITTFVMPTSVTDSDVSSLHKAFEKFANMVAAKKQGMLSPGLISHAWEEEEGNVKESNSGSGFLHEIKMSWLKNPFSIMKSVLFY